MTTIKLNGYKNGGHFSEYLSVGCEKDNRPYYSLMESCNESFPAIFHLHGRRWEELIRKIEEFKYSYDHASYGLPDIGYYHPDGWRLVSHEGYMYVLADYYGGGVPNLVWKCKYFPKEDIDLVFTRVRKDED
jgi:hypothetical protein